MESVCSVVVKDRLARPLTVSGDGISNKPNRSISLSTAGTERTIGFTIYGNSTTELVPATRAANRPSCHVDVCGTAVNCGSQGNTSSNEKSSLVNAPQNSTLSADCNALMRAESRPLCDKSSPWHETIWTRASR
jgi:hypothetical protein